MFFPRLPEESVSGEWVKKVKGYRPPNVIIPERDDDLNGPLTRSLSSLAIVKYTTDSETLDRSLEKGQEFKGP